MGGGSKHSQDVPKGPAHNILAELAALGTPGFSDAVEFCAQSHRVEFLAVDGSAVAPGQVVELVPGEPPRLVSGKDAIGEVQGEIAKALNGCLNLNYSLSGTIDSFDLTTRLGTATLVGAYQQAA
jgi:hypothetical protein